MGYCDVQALVARFGQAELAQLTDRENGAILDDAVALRAISDASAQMDSYLMTRYRLPLSAVPEVLASVCADIARFLLYKDQPSEEVRTRFEDARQWLKDLAKGQAHLDLPEPQATAYASFQASPRRFTREGLRGF